jgi:hypothetical protein
LDLLKAYLAPIVTLTFRYFRASTRRDQFKHSEIIQDFRISVVPETRVPNKALPRSWPAIHEQALGEQSSSLTDDNKKVDFRSVIPAPYEAPKVLSRPQIDELGESTSLPLFLPGRLRAGLCPTILRHVDSREN